MGLRRRSRKLVVTKEKSKFSCGDLVHFSSNRKFPLGLRTGPGYTFPKIEIIEPVHVGIVLDVQLGHGAMLWLYILGPHATIGWVPESLACI